MNEPLSVKQVLEQCIELYERKDHDYSNGVPLRNFFFAREHGERPDHGIVTRLGDKFMRLCALTAMERKGGADRPAVADESLDDTVRDIINYAAILLVIRDMMARETELR